MKTPDAALATLRDACNGCFDLSDQRLIALVLDNFEELDQMMSQGRIPTAWDNRKTKAEKS